MKLTENIDAKITAFEQEIGKKIKPQIVELIKAMAVAGDSFEALGQKDACGGYAPRPKEAFVKWGKRELIDPEGKDQPIVELMYQCYLDGYNEGVSENEEES